MTTKRALCLSRILITTSHATLKDQQPIDVPVQWERRPCVIKASQLSHIRWVSWGEPHWHCTSVVSIPGCLAKPGLVYTILSALSRAHLQVTLQPTARPRFQRTVQTLAYVVYGRFAPLSRANCKLTFLQREYSFRSLKTTGSCH